MPEGWKNYSVPGNDTHFSVPARYQLESKIGNGQFGTVCKAMDKAIDSHVAIKKIALPNRASRGEPTSTDQLLQLRRVLREVATLKYFNHPNVISLLDLFSARTVTTESNTHDLYIVSQLLEVDLAGCLKLHIALPSDYIRYFGTQLLRGMAYIHSCGIIHRDVKPSNIVVNTDCDLKVVDFGLARDLEVDDDLTEYVVTRYYRAPELLCGVKKYTTAVDIWSVGCVLVEMATGEVLLKGDQARDQLRKIIDLCPPPAASRLDQITSESVRKLLASHAGKPPKINLKDFIDTKRKLLQKDPCGSLYDLVSGMLQFLPEDRVTAEKALEHPFWNEDDEDEPPPEDGDEEANNVLDEPTETPAKLSLRIEKKDVFQLQDMLDDLLASYEDQRELDRKYSANHPEEDEVKKANGNSFAEEDVDNLLNATTTSSPLSESSPLDLSQTIA
ncbi:Mitogen-activated protein kinase pmk-1 [Diplonema papillatum]|nr:Mitogen-activated protein kinase pmk-1 [Diplonema papillatum]